MYYALEVNMVYISFYDAQILLLLFLDDIWDIHGIPHTQSILI
jgi:hypothetical protein